MVRTAVRMDYAAVAFSSAERQSRCWDAQALDRSLDIPAVRHLSLLLRHLRSFRTFKISGNHNAKPSHIGSSRVCSRLVSL